MDKVDAGNLLRINRGASETEVEVAYRKRRDEVRKRFVSARDRNTRNRCEREFSVLEQARNCLLAQMDDLVNEREEPPVERVAARTLDEAFAYMRKWQGDFEIVRVELVCLIEVLSGSPLN